MTPDEKRDRLARLRAAHKHLEAVSAPRPGETGAEWAARTAPAWDEYDAALAAVAQCREPVIPFNEIAARMWEQDG
jgi:hypothetical protein